MRADPPASDSDLPDFGFTFVITRAPKLVVHRRNVYTILQFLGDVGGLDGMLVLILGPLLSFFGPSLFQRKVLNDSFKYDDSKPLW